MADDPDSRGTAASGRLRLQALGWAWLLRIALWVLPFRWTLALVRRAARRRSRRRPVPTSATSVRATVQSMDRFVPRFTCLVQALTAGVLICRSGGEAEIVLGVPEARGGAFEAHAWLKYDGDVVVGGDVAQHAAVARIPLRPA